MNPNLFVRPISIVLPASDGKKTLHATFRKKLFLGTGCARLCDYISPSAPPVEEFIGELEQDGTSEQIFKGFGVELKKLSHTPAQLCDLVVLNKLFPSTLVLLEVIGEFFVAHVQVTVDGSFYVNVRKLAHNVVVWRAKFQPRVLVPQLEPATS